MRSLITTKQAAESIGVSESSIKRWCDRGLMPCYRTAGGHRRLSPHAFLRYLRESGHPLVHPERIGFTARMTQPGDPPELIVERLVGYLEQDDEEAVHGLLLDLFLRDMEITVLFDEVMAPAFHQVGRDWECGKIDVYQERRATEIAMDFLRDLEEMLPEVNEDAALAIGATLEGDPYLLPSRMASLVLRSEGWAARHYGYGIPAASLERAIEDLHPRLLWLSISAIEEPETFLEQYGKLYKRASMAGVALVVGGRALRPELQKRMEFSACCENMGRLAHLVRVMENAASTVAKG